MFHKIKDVKALTGFLLWVEFCDGAQMFYDVSTLFEAVPAMTDLKNIPGLFAQVMVDPGGYGVSWNDALDLDAQFIHANGVLLKSPASLEAGCQCPACGQMIRRKNAAPKNTGRTNLAKRNSKNVPSGNPDGKRQLSARPTTK